MTLSSQHRLKTIPIFKFILIMGVVFIHSNIYHFTPSGFNGYGPEIVNFITSLMQVCVPSFFIISGYLFFYGVDNFTADVYKKKLSSRFKTLFIPYMIWDLFCAALFIIKVLFLNFPGLGIIENDTIHWGRFLEGFVYIEQADGYPYAFAFWFIRNLMVFVILTPIVRLIAWKWWSVILLFFIKLIFDIDLHGIEWFISGAAAGIHGLSPDKFNNKSGIMLFSGILYLVIAIVRFWFIGDKVTDMIGLCLEVQAGFCFLYLLSCRLVGFSTTVTGRQLCSSTFFLYAFHQCFCSVTLKFWLRIVGYNTILSSLLSYLLTFLSLFGISFLTYLLLNRYFPKGMRILSGNRS